MALQSEVLRALEKGPKNIKQLRSFLNTDGKKITHALKELQQAGRVVKKKKVYMLAHEKECVEAKLVKLARTFGFAAPLDGSEDIFIPGHALGGAMPNDVVKVLISPYPRIPGSREGEVVDILQAKEEMVGLVQQQGNRLFLLPDHAPDIPLLIRKGYEKGVLPGEKVAAYILRRASHHEDIRVGILKRFGSAENAACCAEAVLFSHDIPRAFSDEACQQAEAVSLIPLEGKELHSREDLRDKPIFTIDSASTKDIDDAISIERTENGYCLGVHIADVSFYVKGKTSLDVEAMKRGTSVYYADRVIPMLPAVLSNGVCSLNPQEDRYAFSCHIELDIEGRIKGYRFQKSVIRSRVKGVYSEVNALLSIIGGGDAPQELKEKYAEVQESLDVMLELYLKLAALRKARGGIEIESDEPELKIDSDGRCVGVEKRERGSAERMIEEFMLLANTAAAHWARSLQIPFVYRVHERPSEEKILQMQETLKALGISFHFKGEYPTQQELAALLDEVRQTRLETPVHQAVLFSMTKAVYEPIPKGHYGLALEDYAHFTSPIRRYPDLAIHRILSDAVSGVPQEEIASRYKAFVQAASRLSSEKEQAATQIERSCDDIYRAEYMQKFIGKSFEGLITSVAAYGVYVTLPNTVQGLVHSSQLSRRRLQLLDGVCLFEEETGLRYQVGDLICVRLIGVDIAQGNVDFALGEKKE